MAHHTLNASEMKLQNQRKILNILHRHPCSRADLARKTGLTRAAISVIADQLLGIGCLTEGEPVLGKVGRKSYLLQLNPDLYHVIGINISREKFKVGIFDFCGQLLFHTEREILPTPQETLDCISGLLERIQGETAFPGELLGIGITAPGPLDIRRGQILNPPNFALWSFIPIADYFKEIFRCPVVLENNSNALALAEKAYGAGQTLTDFVELNVDTGIGSGVILNEKLYRGSSGLGNDFGHMSINFNGEPCHCGNIGCAELYASIPSILKSAAREGRPYGNWKEIVDAAYLKDPRAMEFFEREAHLLALVIINIINILDVNTVIITGDISYRSELLINRLLLHVNQRIFARAIKKVAILSTEITEHAEIIASENLVFDNYVEHLSREES